MDNLKKKIIIAGAGGTPSEGVIHSLINEEEEIIGIGSEPTDLILSKCAKKYVVPYANTSEYKSTLLKILEKEKPNLIHFQNDLEIFEASKFRDEILKTGTQLFMPPHDVIDTCVHKYKTYLKLVENQIKVPKNLLINNESDLKTAFKDLGNKKGEIWLRSTSIGGGGKGALPTADFNLAKGWIDRYDGWGDFVAAEMLGDNTVTWLSIWHNGELVVAQTRLRKSWAHGNRSASGVTGITKVGQTYSNPKVDEIAIKTIKAVSSEPHGIFGVDMAYDFDGIPNPTEINISRFFTTVRFFTEAGLNMPKIFKDIALYNKFPESIQKINPLPDDLLWLRAMDREPQLFTGQEISADLILI